MIRASFKKNIFILLIASLAVALAAFAFLIPTRAASAEGNNAGATGAVTSIIDISLDVNGRNQITAEDADSTKEKLDANNSKRFRTRTISAPVVTGDDLNTYVFLRNTLVISSEDFDVAVSEDRMNIVITAVKQTRRDDKAGFFSIGIQKGSGSSGDVTTYYFRVTVEDTFVQHTSLGAGEDAEVYVGNTLNSTGTAETTPSFELDKHKAILDIKNYSSVQIDLGQYLLGRALYNRGTPIKAPDSEQFWVLNSVSNFAIKEVTIPGFSINVVTNDIYSFSTPATASDAGVIISPTATFDVQFSSTDITRYEEMQHTDFWAATHTLEVKLREVKDSSKGNYTVYIPINIVPSNPQVKNINADRLRLNVTSQFGYNLTTSTFLNADGTTYDGVDINDYQYVIIRPADLLEYSYPASWGADRRMVFDHALTTLNDSPELTTQQGCRIDRVEGETDSTVPTQYKITGLRSNLANSNFTIKFTVIYPTAATGASTTGTKEVSIAVSTYGGYSVKFDDINGKKAVSYNVLSAGVFADMRERGYQLTGAVSKNPNQLGVNLSNNVLTLTPKVDNINGQTTAEVELTFTNNSKQTITFDSDIIDINVNAGSLFARFDDWQAWLIIAACILGGIILILFIVWLFLRSISKRKQDELATQAPVSSYIVKLNSTIAANQAQQRMAQNQALSQASAQMLLGAGPTGAAAPPPDTLALASGVQSMPGGTPSQPSAPAMSEPQATVPPDSGENLEELIAKYITDEELLERIFTEKYEPKGMVRRTFFKSKDLQARELDKEKKRIIERYKSPMPMDEAIMSENEIKNAGASSTPASDSTPAEAEESTVQMFTLDFDPDSPLYVEPEKAQDEFTEEKIDLDSSPEEQLLKKAEHDYAFILKELEELKNRLDKVQGELNKAKSLEDELREKIAKAESDDEQYGKDIEDLEFKLASARSKDKEKITRDIGIKEEKKKRNLDELEKLRAQLDALLGNSESLNAVYVNLEGLNTQKTADEQNLLKQLEKARADFAAYQDRLAKVKARQELEQKITGLTPMLVEVNNSDYELKRLQTEIEEQDKQRDALKAAVTTAKAQILGATDFGVINDLNTQISDNNAQLSDLEKESTKTNKRKTELQIEFNAQRRKANEYCEKNDIPLEEVILAEDNVIGNIELEILKAAREKDKEESEKAVATAQAVYDDLAASSTDVTMIAMEVASNVKDIEDEIEATQAELDEVNAKMEEASDDERLMLIVEQGDKSDKLEELKAKLEEANVEGTKRKMEAQGEYDAKLEEARAALERANADYSSACTAVDDLVNNTNPLDLITSGSGVISQDQKKIEAENFKKQLERSKNEIEQARLAAQQAQEEAERTRLEAERATEEARAEAERTAQEAIERAEQARLEAEERARAEAEAAERARVEAEEAIAASAEEAARKAQEDAEEAARKAQESADEAARKAQEDAEEAARKAQESADEAARKAQEEAEEAVRKAQEQAEEAARKAQEEIEEMRRKAEEEAEAKRLEEENKRKEEEERLKAESERGEAIAKKVAMRKEQIIAIRNDMKELKGDEDAKNLRERLYNIQLTYDEDERGSSELMDFYNKTMDDIQSAGEIARLKAENAKKPQRVVRKVTERVNRIARRKPRPGAKAGARPASRAGARPASRPGARPAARPGARPGARPASRPGARPTRPGGSRPTRPR